MASPIWRNGPGKLQREQILGFQTEERESMSGAKVGPGYQHTQEGLREVQHFWRGGSGGMGGEVRNETRSWWRPGLAQPCAPWETFGLYPVDSGKL